MFGVPAVVAINAFPTDTPAEVEAIREVALAAGARDAVVATHFAEGGAGRDGPGRGGLGGGRGRRAASFQLLYPDDDAARRQDRDDRHAGLRRRRRRATCRRRAKSLKQFEDLGYGHLPICMAKTQYSLSHDAALKGRPTGFRVPDPRGPAVGRRRVHHAALRRDADDAGPAVAAGRREDRHRRRREHRRAVLDRGPLERPASRSAEAARRERRSRRRSTTADRDAERRRRPRPPTSIGPSASSPWAWSS